MKKKLTVLLMLTIIISTYAKKQVLPPLYWGIYTIDNSGEIWGQSKVRFDAQGKLKLAFRGHYDIRYTEMNGSIWNKPIIVDSNAGSDARVDMVLDKAGNAHIVSQNDNNTKIRYAYFNGTKWNGQLIDSHRYVDFYQFAMAIDSKDGIHMAYPRTVTNNGNDMSSLKYVYLPSSNILQDSAVICPNCGFHGKWTAMTVDAQDKPVISYFRHGEEHLVVAYQENNQWKNQFLDSASIDHPQGFHNTIANDTGNAYYIAFNQKSKNILRLAHGMLGGQWTYEKVDSLIGYTVFSSMISLALDKDQRPFVAYAQVQSSDAVKAERSKLQLAYKEGSDWKTFTIDSSVTIAGEYASMAISPITGLPAISYVAVGAKRELRVAIASLTPIAISPKSNHGKTKAPRIDLSKKAFFDAQGKSEKKVSASGLHFSKETGMLPVIKSSANRD